MVQQLTLNLRPRDDATFANFYIGDNAELYAYLESFCVGNVGMVAYLSGAVGSGRSHLLQACCLMVTEQGGTAIYLPLTDNNIEPEMLDGLENLSLVCLDDLDLVAGQRYWEEALFHLFNRLQVAGNKFLTAANNIPSGLKFVLPDLQSRLASGVVFQLQQLTDSQKKMALVMRAKNRGLKMPDEVANYLLTRFSRNPDDLFNVLEKLDQASWQAGRKLTIPFIKNIS